MKSELRHWNQSWSISSTDVGFQSPNLVIVLGQRELVENPKFYKEVSSFYPDTDIVTASTAGEIFGIEVLEGTIVSIAIAFDKTPLKLVEFDVESVSESFDVGVQLYDALDQENLQFVFVLSDGQSVNGSELLDGINKNRQEHVIVTGGVAGDGDAFQKTVVGLNKVPQEAKVVGVGFYGDALQVGYASQGGWDTFGPKRLITKSEANVLYELDGKPALDLYKQYLGDLAKELPSSALLFPLSLDLEYDGVEEHQIVRTILSVNDEEGSMTFAGNLPQGGYAQMMKSNFDRLIDASEQAAKLSLESLKSEKKPKLAILVSCVGRKLLLKNRVEEEVECIKEVFGDDTIMLGFYSYGEMCPTPYSTRSELHNETMTITILSEQ